VNHVLRSARFALLVGLSAAIPALVALDPPRQQDQNKQQPKDDKKKAEPAKKAAPAADERLDRRDSRMKERNREIDGLLNKKKK
jgi:hypothetical protein